MLPVELQQTDDLRPAELTRPFTADGRSALNHVGTTADDPAAESARLDLLASSSSFTPPCAKVDFFRHEALDEFGYCIEVIARVGRSTPSSTRSRPGARDSDGRDPTSKV